MHTNGSRRGRARLTSLWPSTATARPPPSLSRSRAITAGSWTWPEFDQAHHHVLALKNGLFSKGYPGLPHGYNGERSQGGWVSASHSDGSLRVRSAAKSGEDPGAGVEPDTVVAGMRGECLAQSPERARLSGGIQPLQYFVGACEAADPVEGGGYVRT